MNYLQKLYIETCVFVSNNVCGKLASFLELPITFDDSFRAIQVSFLLLTLV